MKAFTFLLILTLLFSIEEAVAQNILVYSGEGFTFKVTMEKPIANERWDIDGAVSSIAVYRKADDSLIQVILPAEKCDCTFPKEQLFIIEDVNFDGLDDIRLVHSQGTASNVFYYYWLYNKYTKRFVQNKELEEIASPKFEKDKKIITSAWVASYVNKGKSTYTYIDGKVKMTAEEEVSEDLNHPNIQVTTKKAWVNGRMKLIDKTQERIDKY